MSFPIPAVNHDILVLCRNADGGGCHAYARGIRQVGGFLSKIGPAPGSSRRFKLRLPNTHMCNRVDYTGKNDNASPETKQT
jgi:hypothetical protein